MNRRTFLKRMAGAIAVICGLEIIEAKPEENCAGCGWLPYKEKSNCQVGCEMGERQRGSLDQLQALVSRRLRNKKGFTRKNIKDAVKSVKIEHKLLPIGGLGQYEQWR